MKFHVSYGPHKRLVDLNVSDLSTFTQSVCQNYQHLNHDNFIMQYYIQELDDWVDVDDIALKEFDQNSVTKIKVQ